MLLFGAKSLKCKKDLEGSSTLESELLELAGESTQPARAAARDTPELLPETEDGRKKPRRDSIYGEGRLF